MIKSLLFIAILLTSFLVKAELAKAPPAFMSGDQKAVWTDFQKADYRVVFDVKKQKVESITEIEFEILEEGFPLFDSVNEVSEILVNGILVGQRLIKTPGNETSLRIIEKKLKPGLHKMTITSSLLKGVVFDKKKVSAGFFMKDMRDREFLERYLPSNLEYDQYKIKLQAQVVGTDKEHRLFTNGKFLRNRKKNSFSVEYPSFFNASSLYFHLVPKKKFKVKESKFTSIDGREVPITVYSKSKVLNSLTKRKIFKVLKELEKDYGPWPHPQMILYSNSKLRGGMEYAGAAVSGWFAIGHELQHGYFARAVMPKNGSSGWIDEAIASWRDFFHRKSKKPKFDSSDLGNKSPYVRKTDLASYKKGRSFMSYLEYKITKETNTNLKAFLRSYFANRKYSTVDNEVFIKDLEEFTGLDMQKTFDQYIHGKKGQKSEGKNPYHLQLTEKDLRDII